MTPQPRYGLRVGVPHAGAWHEVLNSDAAVYGGSGVGNLGTVQVQDGYAVLTLPPLATIMLEHEQ